MSGAKVGDAGVWRLRLHTWVSRSHSGICFCRLNERLRPSMAANRRIDPRFLGAFCGLGVLKTENQVLDLQ